MITWRKANIKIGKRNVSARLADSLIKRAFGFMFYSKEEKDAIVFKGGGKFWMLFVPKDIQLVEVKKGKVSRVINMKANTLTMHEVDGDYAIELINFPPIRKGERVILPRNLF